MKKSRVSVTFKSFPSSLKTRGRVALSSWKRTKMNPSGRNPESTLNLVLQSTETSATGLPFVWYHTVWKNKSAGRQGFKLVMFPGLLCSLWAVRVISALCWQVRRIARRGDLLVAGRAVSVSVVAAVLSVLLCRARALRRSRLLGVVRAAVLVQTVGVRRLGWVLFPLRRLRLRAAGLWGPKRTILGLQWTGLHKYPY